jgi:hypothetical protein
MLSVAQIRIKEEVNDELEGMWKEDFVATHSTTMFRDKNCCADAMRNAIDNALLDFLREVTVDHVRILFISTQL